MYKVQKKDLINKFKNKKNKVKIKYKYIKKK